MLALINDVLDVSRIESGKLRMERRSVDLRSLIEDVLKLATLQAKDTGIELVLARREVLSLRAWGDLVRLRQVVLNLVSIAIKYNRPGGLVHISVTATSDVAQIEIADTGMGMSKEQLAHLFEPFNRLGREGGAVDGTGIGMALSRELLRLMGGHIDVKSEVDVGSLVRVTLPISVETESEHAQVGVLEEQEDEAQEAEPAGLVLYVEDNPVNLLIVEQLLARWPKVRFAQAETGRKGIELAANLQPDLVLLDMRLPDMDGVQVLTNLRSHDSTRKLPVIALSASAMPEEVELAMKSGALGYWTKPIDFEKFLENLRWFLRSKAHVGAK